MEKLFDEFRGIAVQCAYCIGVCDHGMATLKHGSEDRVMGYIRNNISYAIHKGLIQKKDLIRFQDVFEKGLIFYNKSSNKGIVITDGDNYVTIRGDAMAYAFDQSTVYASDQSVVSARDTTIVFAEGNAMITATSSVEIHAMSENVVVNQISLRK